MKLAVLTKGEDYHYPLDPMSAGSGCEYRRDGEPSCLIGHALDILGIQTTEADEERDAGVVLRHYGIVDADLCTAAVEAQDVQDRGLPWGEALDAYLEIMTPEKIAEEEFRVAVSKSLVARMAERIALGKKG